MAEQQGLLNEIALLTKLLENKTPRRRKAIRKPMQVTLSSRLKFVRLTNEESTASVPSSSLNGKVLEDVHKSEDSTKFNVIVDKRKLGALSEISRKGQPSKFKWSKSRAFKSAQNVLSKYNLDRRVRKPIYRRSSNVFKFTRTNFNSSSISFSASIGAKSNTISPRKFSIRKYSIRKLRSNLHSSEKNSGADFRLRNGRKGSHHVVRIDGTKYLSVNSGKTLRRIRAPSASLSSFQSVNKYVTPTHRSANRVLQKSIATLSGGYQKNSVCYFLRNYGHCKRKENGACPFFHGLSTDANSPVRTRSPQKVWSRRCRDFKLGQCLRSKCPFQHENDLLNRYRRRLTWKPQRKRVPTSGPKRARKRKHEEKIDQTRYFEAEPETNPVVSVIKRRLPKGVEKNASIEIITIDSSDSEDSEDSTTKSSSSLSTVQEQEQMVSATAQAIQSLRLPVEDINTRRQRLLNKLVTFKKRIEKGPNPMPDFLPL